MAVRPRTICVEVRIIPVENLTKPKTSGLKFVMTQFGHETDISGLADFFSILGECRDLAEAHALLNDTGDRVLAEQLGQHSDWHIVEDRGLQSYPSPSSVNRHNKVAASRSFEIDDGSRYNVISTVLELVELPDDTVVDENLFDLEHCGYCVRRYFENLRMK